MTETALKPCPFCGAGETILHVNHGTWTGMKYGSPISVEVRHWCTNSQGQPSRGITRIGRDEESAIAAWNSRTPTFTQADMDAALLAEREACALICENRVGIQGTGAFRFLTSVAEAIRERGTN